MNTPEHQLIHDAERLIESADDRRRRLNRERQARWRARLRQKRGNASGKQRAVDKRLARPLPPLGNWS
jgi:hypothetical protein